MICQLVVQEEYRKAVVSLTHDSSMTEHLGVNETSNGILVHFYLPNIRRDVAENCWSCSICRVMGKMIQSFRVAPLRYVLSFEGVMIQCRQQLDLIVAALKHSENWYLQGTFILYLLKSVHHGHDGGVVGFNLLRQSVYKKYYKLDDI